jgi:hypothetical protein
MLPFLAGPYLLAGVNLLRDFDDDDDHKDMIKIPHVF